MGCKCIITEWTSNPTLILIDISKQRRTYIENQISIKQKISIKCDYDILGTAKFF